MSHFKHVLTPDEITVVVELCRGLKEKDPKAAERLQAARLKAALEALAAQGDERLTAGLADRIALEGHRQLYVVGHHLAFRRFVVLPDGTTVETNAATGVAPKGEAPSRTYQLVMFPELTWDQVERKFLTAVGRVKADQREVACWAEVLKLRDEHPDTKTVGEACACAGIDWRTFAVGETG